MKKLLAQFNTPDTLLVITSFPKLDKKSSTKKGFNAVGWHSERTLRPLSKQRKVLVCAEEIGSSTEESLTKNLLVQRVWKKSNLLSFIPLARFILKMNKIKSIFVEFEFNVFGGIVPNLVVIAILGLLRLTGRRVTFELHQVITDIAKLEKHINITNPLIQRFFNISLSFFYRILGIVSNDIIVFEQELKNKLQKYVKADKITVLSLSVDKQKTIDMQMARKSINQTLALDSKNERTIKKEEFVILVFGFINGYKGIDWILNALKGVGDSPRGEAGRNIRLLIAGGANPYLKDKPDYQAFYQSILSEIQKYPHVTHSGFIPEEEITTYFSASDMVVLPYEVFMSASGPFSHTLSYEKPVLISEHLGDYAKTADFQEALMVAGIEKNDIVFSLNRKSLLSRIEKAQKSSAYLEKLTVFSQTLGTLRSMTRVVSRLDSVVFPQGENAPSFPLSSSLAPAQAEASN